MGSMDKVRTCPSSILHLLISFFFRPKLEGFVSSTVHKPLIGLFGSLVGDWIPLIDQYYYCEFTKFSSIALLIWNGRYRPLAGLTIIRCTLISIPLFAVISYVNLGLICTPPHGQSDRDPVHSNANKAKHLKQPVREFPHSRLSSPLTVTAKSSKPTV